MKTLKCREISGTCDFVATGETNEEVKQKLAEHGMEAHPEELSKMTDEQKKEMEKKEDESLAAQTPTPAN
ncbi:MAG: DUF1059 domain-containing protein [Patescibacteria group bacterium]